MIVLSFLNSKLLLILTLACKQSRNNETDIICGMPSNKNTSVICLNPCFSYKAFACTVHVYAVRRVSIAVFPRYAQSIQGGGTQCVNVRQGRWFDLITKCHGLIGQHIQISFAPHEGRFFFPLRFSAKHSHLHC